MSHAGMADDSSQRPVQPPPSGRAQTAELDRRIADSVLRFQHRLEVSSSPELTWGVFEKGAPLRQTLFALMLSPRTDVVLAVLVIANAFAMGFFNPLLPSTAPRNVAVTSSSIAINSIFAIELVLKLMAFGAWGRGSFFIAKDGSLDAWNCVDLALVGLGYGEISPLVGQLSAIRFLRLFRWAYARVAGMRTVLVACYNALPGLSGVLLLAGVTYLVFGLIGRQRAGPCS